MPAHAWTRRVPVWGWVAFGFVGTVVIFTAVLWVTLIGPRAQAAEDERHRRAGMLSNEGLRKYWERDFVGALRDLDEAVRLKIDHAPAYHNRGMVRCELKDRAGGMADYDRAIALDPTLSAPYNSRGLQRAFEGEPEAAILDYDQAIRRDPEFAPAYANRAVARLWVFDEDGAASDAAKALSIHPEWRDRLGAEIEDVLRRRKR